MYKISGRVVVVVVVVVTRPRRSSRRADDVALFQKYPTGFKQQRQKSQVSPPNTSGSNAGADGDGMLLFIGYYFLLVVVACRNMNVEIHGALFERR